MWSKGKLFLYPKYQNINVFGISRWMQNGTWHKLTAMKDVIVEPRQMRDFADEMQRFDDAIKEAERDCNIFRATQNISFNGN
jgi:hypothetical protein